MKSEVAACNSKALNFKNEKIRRLHALEQSRKTTAMIDQWERGQGIKKNKNNEFDKFTIDNYYRYKQLG